MLLAAVYRHWPLRPLADRFRRQQFFRTREWRAMQYGVFGSHSEAHEFCNRHGVKSHYDLDHDWWRKQQAALHLHDYPILLHMSRALHARSRVADLGGSVGVSYYALKPLLPPFMEWRVCELPDVVEKGRELARERGASSLHFTEHVSDLDGHDVLLTAGAIQYIEQPFYRLLGGLRNPPRHVLVNRLPVHFTVGDFVTLQNTGKAITTCRVVNQQTFIAEMREAGYERKNSWQCPQHSLHVPLHPSHSVRSFTGYYFVRRE